MDDSLNAFRALLADRYAFIALAGRGGMADVYVATDLRHGRPVAVKILRSHLGLSVDSVRFAREIETAARLQHPHILPVYESGEAAECLFFVMPYVSEGSLRARLDATPTLPWAEAFAIVLEVGDALAFAHANNVVHRDIKPENILFLAGHAVVADFGIARAMKQSDGERITMAGYGLGTPEYMSPEQAFGEAEVDARSDMYSLACVLHEMLSGQPPFTGEQPFALLLKKTTESPPLLQTGSHTAIPTAVADILQRALARDASDRFPDVRAMLTALRRAHAGASDSAHEVATRKADTPSIGVLPFTNLTGQPDDEYLADGLSEELIQALAQVHGIRVVARTSSFRFRNFTGDIRNVGHELSVAFLLEGSMRRSGNRLRISARLIDVRSGFERWSERFDREFANVFDVQDEIARAIVVSLEGALRPSVGDLVRAPTADMTAYDAFLEARFHWNQRSPAALHRAVACLKRATSRDPSFAQAHSALAEALLTLAMYGEGQPQPLMHRARASAQQSIALKPDFTPARTVLACITALYDWNWVVAEREFVAAAEAPQASATAFQWFAANMLVPQQRFADAHQQLARAKLLDPLSPTVALSVGITYHAAGNHPAAIVEFDALLARDPQFGMASYFLARAHSALSQHTGALRNIERARATLADSVECVGAHGVLLANAERHDDARARLNELDALATQRYLSPVTSAEILAALGDFPLAMARLQHAVSIRATDLAWIGARPAFQSMTVLEDFNALVQQVGIPVRAMQTGV